MVFNGWYRVRIRNFPVPKSLDISAMTQPKLLEKGSKQTLFYTLSFMFQHIFLNLSDWLSILDLAQLIRNGLRAKSYNIALNHWNSWAPLILDWDYWIGGQTWDFEPYWAPQDLRQLNYPYLVAQQKNGYAEIFLGMSQWNNSVCGAFRPSIEGSISTNNSNVSVNSVKSYYDIHKLLSTITESLLLSHMLRIKDGSLHAKYSGRCED